MLSQTLLTPITLMSIRYGGKLCHMFELICTHTTGPCEANLVQPYCSVKRVHNVLGRASPSLPPTQYHPPQKMLTALKLPFLGRFDTVVAKS